MLADLKKQILQKGIAGDIFSQEQTSRSIVFENNRFKSNESSQSSGHGVRIVNKDGREGFSFGNSAESHILDKSLELAEFGEKVTYTFPEGSNFKKTAIFFPETLDKPAEYFIEKGQGLIKSILSEFPKLNINLDYSYGGKKVSLWNSSGFDDEYQKTFFSFSLSGFLAHGDELTEIYESLVSHSLPETFNSVVDGLKEKFIWAQKKSKVSSGFYPVLFTPKALRSFMNILLTGFNGKHIEKGVSPIIDRMGLKLGNENFSVIDDGLNLDMVTASPWDSEGIPSEKHYLIKNGVIMDGIYDLKTAAKLNKKPTANGMRSYASLPHPGFRSIYIETGKTSKEEIISSIDHGIIVDQFLGAGMSNVMAGEFSANIDLGFVVKNGKIRGRLKDTMINGNVFDMIAKIAVISQENSGQGSALYPYILFDNINVIV